MITLQYRGWQLALSARQRVLLDGHAAYESARVVNSRDVYEIVAM